MGRLTQRETRVWEISIGLRIFQEYGLFKFGLSLTHLYWFQVDCKFLARLRHTGLQNKDTVVWQLYSECRNSEFRKAIRLLNSEWIPIRGRCEWAFRLKRNRAIFAFPSRVSCVMEIGNSDWSTPPSPPKNQLDAFLSNIRVYTDLLSIAACTFLEAG